MSGMFTELKKLDNDKDRKADAAARSQTPKGSSAGARRPVEGNSIPRPVRGTPLTPLTCHVTELGRLVAYADVVPRPGATAYDPRTRAHPDLLANQLKRLSVSPVQSFARGNLLDFPRRHFI